MISSAPRLTLRGCPVDAVQQSAREQHCPHTEEEAQHPTHLGPGATSREENGGAGPEHEEGHQVQPTAYQRSSQCGRRVRSNRRTTHHTTLEVLILSSRSCAETTKPACSAYPEQAGPRCLAPPANDTKI